MLNERFIKFRHLLHRHPELSGREVQTAKRIVAELSRCRPDRVITELGGNGVAAVFISENPGPSLLFRCELDALPIDEINDFSHRSMVQHVSHKCGHDGHMAILLKLAHWLESHRPLRGRIVLLFQPAEETGDGARAVVADPQFSALRPDYAYALHNLPGHPLGKVMTRPGCFNCASQGIILQLHGTSSHAAHPEDGNSPAAAMCNLIRALQDTEAHCKRPDEIVMITLIHAQLGEVAFGTAPGEARVMATLRSETDQSMQGLVEEVIRRTRSIAEDYHLDFDYRHQDVFAASCNDEQAVAAIQQVAEALSLDQEHMHEPFRWSEDFGCISASCKGAMFALGAGMQCPQLHNPDYDFPDALIQTGFKIFRELALKDCY